MQLSFIAKKHFKLKSKTENWVPTYESHGSDLIIFIILFANSSDGSGLLW